MFTHSGTITEIGNRTGGVYFLLENDDTQYLARSAEVLIGARVGDRILFVTTHKIPNLAVPVFSVITVHALA